MRCIVRLSVENKSKVWFVKNIELSVNELKYVLKSIKPTYTIDVYEGKRKGRDIISGLENIIEAVRNTHFYKQVTVLEHVECKKTISTFYEQPFLLDYRSHIGITVIKPRDNSYTYIMKYDKESLEEIFGVPVFISVYGNFYVWGEYSFWQESYYKRHLQKVTNTITNQTKMIEL